MNSEPSGGTLFDCLDNPDVMSTPGQDGGSDVRASRPRPPVQEPPSYNPLPPCRRAVATSVAAAVSVQPYTGTQRGVILHYLRTRPDGATREEIVAATGMREASVCGRLAELQGKCKYHERHIIESGTRPSSAGRPVKVYKVIG